MVRANPNIVWILNRSTLASDQLVRRGAVAIAAQVRRDFGPAWGVFAQVKFAARGQTIGPREAVVIVVDNSSEDDAVGWHTLSKRGRPCGIVAIQPELDAGTQWTVALSHEVLELLADRWLGFSVVYRRKAYAVEVCDPCEADRYGYLIRGVLVSDFVTPAWYRLTDQGPYSFMGSCKRPFHILPGGYLETQDFRERRPAIRRHDGRPLPRSKIAAGSRKARRSELQEASGGRRRRR